MKRSRPPSVAGLALCLSLCLALCPAAAQAAGPPAFAGHWEDCENFPDVCFGYQLEQKGATVCGSLTRASKTDATRSHGHLRGDQAGDLLANVAVCGVESRSTCPQIVPANRRGLLLCGDRLFETGGRQPTCVAMTEHPISQPYRRVSAQEFAVRFGAQQASLCAVPVSTKLEATPPPR